MTNQDRVVNALRSMLSGVNTSVIKFLFGDDIFLSYSRADGATYAAGLADKLAERGFSTRFDQWGSEPGEEMPASLKKALRRSSALVLIGTPKAARSKHVAEEVNVAKTAGRLIVPLVFEGSQLPNLLSVIAKGPHRP